jgi:2-desacetyl-2-hydroxyethyl bacteriochlorophyllide A dehydrogenase
MVEQAKAVVIDRPFAASVREIRLPKVDDASIVVRTHYSAITTGTELKTWNGRTGKLGGKLWYPLVPGYEQVGVVEYVGPNAKATATGEMLRVGDRVMANECRVYPDHCAAWGGQVALTVKNDTTAGAVFDAPAKIPDGVTFQQAVVAYLAAVAKKGIDKAGVRAGETVVVIGMGAVGLSALQLAKLAGATTIAVDISPWRVERVRRFADHIVVSDGAKCHKPVAEVTSGRMADVVIEASGDSAVVNALCTLVREGGWDRNDDGGRIHLQGDYPDPISITQYSQWFNRNLRLSTSCALRPGDKEFMLNLIAQGRFDADILYDKTVAVEDVPSEYAELESHHGDRIKTLIKWV